MTQSIPAALTRWLAAFDNAVLRQHREPIAFFEEVEREGIWHVFWPGRLLAILAVPIFMRSVVTFGEANSMVWVARLTALTLTMQFQLLGFLIMVTQSWWFWFLYIFSPPLLVLSIVCGFGEVTLVAFVLGWVMGVPFALGVLLADALALVFYKQAREVQSKRARQRDGGPAAELPILSQWQRVRLIRLAVAGLLITGAIATLLFYGQSIFWLSAAILFAAAGCTHFDATLLAWVGKWPLASYDSKDKISRATYIGRHALFVPLKSIVQTITLESKATEASTALLALLREGCLGPLLPAACARLSDEHIYSLLLHLSLHEGGAEAIRFLEPALPQALRQTAQHYANLATEAAKPLDLQRWVGLLPPSPDDSATSTLDRHVRRTLVHAREALLLVEYTPSIDLACQKVRSLVEKLYDAETTASDLPLSWPVALLRHLEEQRRLLRPSSASSVTSAPSPSDGQSTMI